VSHTHWDREWYAPLEWFRSRLVITVDRALDLLAADPGWSFVLDGQVSVVEDYLADRPGRRDELIAAVRARRLAIGPWYVQPDSLLPAGEAHVRNLLEAGAAAGEIGPTSRVAYTPDSFGHPAWFPSLFAGFDLHSFVFWRGHGTERDHLPARWRWVGADGAAVAAVHLEGSYLSAATLEPDAAVAAARLRDLAASLAVRSPGHVLLMNGIDHAMPDAHTAEVVDAVAELSGWDVRRGTLDDALERLPEPEDAWQGALVGARDANLLPGVWSSRLDAKLANQRLESALWDAEHLAALVLVAAGVDERPVLRRVRRTMLENQAHDTIGGCSIDQVHREAAARASSATTAARAAARRFGDLLAGAAPRHLAPWADEFDVAVWNPTPWPRREVVSIDVNGWPAFRVRGTGIERHPAHVASLDGDGFLVDGAPCRVVDAGADGDRFHPGQRLVALQAEVDLPALGWTRVRVSRGPAAGGVEVVDDERDLHHRSGARVHVADDGTCSYTWRERTWTGLLAVVDDGDRGDTYDADPLGDHHVVRLDRVSVVRRRHVTTGLGELVVRRRLSVPACLADDRAARVDAFVPLDVTTTLSFDPAGRLLADVRVESTARDHRVRVRLPLGGDRVLAADQFGQREHLDAPAVASAPGWVHGPATSFCHQGWVAADGLLVVTPGLPEAAWSHGSLDFTVLRAVGWMSRPDLRSRPGRASPAIPVPEAQLGAVHARLTIGPDPAVEADRWHLAAAASRPPIVSLAGHEPPVQAGEAQLHVTGAVATALKPAEDGDGVVLRVWNPTDRETTATIGAGIGTAIGGSVRRCRLDETVLAIEVPPPTTQAVGTVVRLAPHEIATYRLSPSAVAQHPLGDAAADVEHP
jgi:hypothetical protein